MMSDYPPRLPLWRHCGWHELLALGRSKLRGTLKIERLLQYQPLLPYRLLLMPTSYCLLLKHYWLSTATAYYLLLHYYYNLLTS